MQLFTSRQQLLRGVSAAAVALAASLACAMPAAAASEHFFSGGLAAGQGYASTSAHSGVYYAQVVSDHTACAGIDSGRTGYFWGAPLDFGPMSACGPGLSKYNGNSAWTTFYHGAVFNPNISTSDSVSDSHYSW